MNAEQRASLVDDLAEKNNKRWGDQIKLGDYIDDKTENGLRMAARPFAGKVNGHDVIGMYELLSADKPVFIVMVAAADGLKGDLEKIINSIKKTE